MLSGLFQTFAAACGNPGFFGIPTWYKYLISAGYMQTVTHNLNGASASTCEMVGLSGGKYNWPDVILLIALAIIDILLRVAGLIAVAFVFYGGVRYVTSHGEPDKTKEAQESIINAIIGTFIVLVAIAAVSFIGNTLG